MSHQWETRGYPQVIQWIAPAKQWTVLWITSRNVRGYARICLWIICVYPNLSDIGTVISVDKHLSYQAFAVHPMLAQEWGILTCQPDGIHVTGLKRGNVFISMGEIAAVDVVNSAISIQTRTGSERFYFQPLRDVPPGQDPRPMDESYLRSVVTDRQLFNYLLDHNYPVPRVPGSSGCLREISLVCGVLLVGFAIWVNASVLIDLVRGQPFSDSLVTNSIIGGTLTAILGGCFVFLRRRRPAREHLQHIVAFVPLWIMLAMGAYAVIDRFVL